ncbi:Nicotinate-nucleotide adenylyltransferase [Sedimentisphaera cyanobacteriorum]|uniref:Probable nicotinate-nucleotide adenylyltransferase n=1 Tax=Sedimentisphaera cyanobacteriorum TaxID=1940790 RepID=A0A1Q2HRP9_9BACT|nr:nicotinate (nicotinamide) nucleotide adenylyltransferase [Sedimentisphaera cyanobacteriorum]AQQ10127.1 Nicotinate-nucleotide adenylyltransferase [Sedimentisphaera cyanobacteriorum]
MTEKILLFGGTFDPVHNGHTNILQAAYKQGGFDRAIVLPNAVSPFKPGSPEASNTQRLEMLRLAFSGLEWCSISDMEFYMPQPSYTVNTLEKLKSQMPSSELFWLCGGDVIKEFHMWYRADEIIELASLAVVKRDSVRKPDFEDIEAKLGKNIPRMIIDSPIYDISSTEIRRRLRKGSEISGLVPKAVEQYIKQNNIYSAHSAG